MLHRPAELVAFILSSIAFAGTPGPAIAQERPYFVTYDHHLEEAGEVEIGLSNTTGIPKDGHSAYHAPWIELEYGVRSWWTTELYVESVFTNHDGSAFTGWRVENRFRPLKDEHRINPVLYFEYEHVNEASRIQKEIVGSGGIAYEPIAGLRSTPAHELEGKLILSTAVRGWNFAENLTVEKNLSEDEGLEFGYSVGVSRAFGEQPSGAACRFCAESFTAGVEVYGGLGSTLDFSGGDQRHYLAPVLGWRLGDHSTLKASIAAGLTHASDKVLIRVGYIYEFEKPERH